MIVGNFVQASADLDPCLSHGYNDILSTIVFWHNAINISVFFPVLLKQSIVKGITLILERRRTLIIWT